MLGTVCFRLCIHRGSQCPPAVLHAPAHHSIPHHPAQITCRLAACVNVSRSLSWSRQHAHVYAGECTLQAVSPFQRTCCHSSSCVTERSEASCATIWHGLLPSHHPSILDQGSAIPPIKDVAVLNPHLACSFGSPSIIACKKQESSGPCASVLGGGLQGSSRKRYVSGLKFPDASMMGNGRFAIAAGLVDGSWNVAWDARPARWLHGRNSAWLLFGVCACFSVAAGISVPTLPLPLSSLSRGQGVKDDTGFRDAFEGKQVFTDYSITGIPGDGRCLFRAIAYGACLRKGDPAPSDGFQQELADELRMKVVDELINRRGDCEWFIEDDFDTYARRMRECYVWGGEPELLMASHVLRMPIIVHLLDRSTGGIISIAEYGLEYGTANPIRVLYHGFGHYDAVQVPGIGTLQSCNDESWNKTSRVVRQSPYGIL